ncbi:response regulator transcription factor [Entomobacter blattae]|uniref:Transcriptional activator protein CzcR n=1 Tax=Entomobacter blattae TaxID=2762277 RepID=A0A7H1NUS3_9PROT|nr:response regulator transcription factor [Entomobacter blattae]QNT79533.1 Transcriptional activator protein CzcR [Entomobacter blattae]
MRVLLVEDDPTVKNFIVKGLRQGGHEVEEAENGSDSLALALAKDYDIIILDRMLPGEIDGLKVLQTLRKEGNTTPVLILSALGEVDEKVAGLQAGGDDYVPKPFSFKELLARVEALSRRTKNDVLQPTKLVVSDLELDLLERTVYRGNKKIGLHPREFRLLEYLMRHAGQTVTRSMLLEKIWDYHFDPQTNVIDVHVSRLRHKIDKPFSYPLIHTIRHEGYILRHFETDQGE